MVIGNLQLPSSAVLHLDKLENYRMDEFEIATLSKIDNTAGVILQLTMEFDGSNLISDNDWGYLEGCVRVLLDNGDYMYLSSGFHIKITKQKQTQILFFPPFSHHFFFVYFTCFLTFFSRTHVVYITKKTHTETNKQN